MVRRQSVALAWLAALFGCTSNAGSTRMRTASPSSRSRPHWSPAHRPKGSSAAALSSSCQGSRPPSRRERRWPWLEASCVEYTQRAGDLVGSGAAGRNCGIRCANWGKKRPTRTGSGLPAHEMWHLVPHPPACEVQIARFCASDARALGGCGMRCRLPRTRTMASGEEAYRLPRCISRAPSRSPRHGTASGRS